MKLSPEINHLADTFTSHFPSQRLEPSVHYEDMYNGIDYDEPYGGNAVAIMQENVKYHLIESTKQIAQNISNFVDKHPVISAVGTAAAFVAADVLLDRATRSKQPLPVASQV